jgi:DNA polymerase (family 10)
LKGGYLIDGFVHVDFKLVPKESWAFSLCHFTGSKYENIELRRRALSKGVTLNEYGFFRDGERINGIFNTEEDIYNFLQLPYKLPQSR